MSENESRPVEDFEVWLSEKPYWEQYVWKLNYEKVSLNEDDIDECYQYLSEYLGIAAATSIKKDPISFKNRTFVSLVDGTTPTKLRLVEIKNFNGVNALSKDCSIKCGPNLTLIYGMNGSGKSGVSRLLCNACFSRGEREILPNVKEILPPETKVGARFVMSVGSEEPTETDYTLGIDNKDLKRFSVFDAKSVLIHLDKPNSVNFTPAQIRLFDKVADTIVKLERKLDLEKYAKRKDNPFALMFLDQSEVSSIASFCRSINSSTKDEDFLNHANFNPEVDEEKMKELETQIAEKRKLDIPKKKSQLTTDRENLGALKINLQSVIGHFTLEKMQEANKLADDIFEKKKLIEELSVQKFDDGLFKTIGSAEWKSLIAAAKALYESEKTANNGNDPVHCLLCHQGLHQAEKTLFENYWRFLESKAEAELSELKRKQTKLLEMLRNAKTAYPQFLITDAGIKVLTDNDTTYLTGLKAHFVELTAVLDDWISKVSQSQKVDRETVPSVDLARIDALVTAKNTEESNLRDPSSEIARLAAQLMYLRHKKAVTAGKESALEYISSLRWLFNANCVSFAGIKGALTKKRTEAFQSGVLSNYFEIFNQELQNFGCKFDLTLSISGDQGNTVREYKFEFAEDYNPSQILSEGEQNACSLADFLTEVQIDKNNCGIIFDDPVTSLDHERKDKIAKRLVTEAGKRQVIIFTHDIVFMSQLVKHSGDQTSRSLDEEREWRTWLYGRKYKSKTGFSE